MLFIEFKVSRYTLKSRPLVVRNASSHWLATSLLDYAWLKTEYLRCCVSVTNAKCILYAEKLIKKSALVWELLLTSGTVFLCEFCFLCSGSVTFWYGSGSAPLTNGCGPYSGSYSFRHWFKTPTKNNFLNNFFAYYFFKIHLHHSSKIQSHKEVTKQLKSRFYSLLFSLDDRRIRICNSDWRIRIREAQKLTYPNLENLFFH